MGEKKYQYLRKDVTIEGRVYTFRGKTQEELFSKIAEKRREIEEGLHRITGKMTVNQWVDEWLETYKRPTVGDGRYKTIKYMLPHIRRSMGKVRLRDVRPAHIMRTLGGLSECTDAYIRSVMAVLHDVFNVAKINHLIAANPCDDVKTPRGRKTQSRRSLTDAEKETFLRTALLDPRYLYFLIMLRCGLRNGEVAALRWSDIDLDAARIRVTRARKARSKEEGDPKSAAGVRTVPIPSDLLAILRERRGLPFALVCPSRSGGVMPPNTTTRLWERFVNDWNILAGCQVRKGRAVPPFRIDPRITPYYLRHTYCTDLQAAGVPINVARELMGHADITVTSRIYTHTSSTSIDAAETALNALISDSANATAKKLDTL